MSGVGTIPMQKKARKIEQDHNHESKVGNPYSIACHQRYTTPTPTQEIMQENEDWKKEKNKQVDGKATISEANSNLRKEIEMMGRKKLSQYKCKMF